MMNCVTRFKLATMLGVSVGLLLVFAGRPFAQETKEGVTTKALEGTWTGTRWDSGKGEDESKGVKLSLTFKGDRVIGKRVPSGNIGEGTIKIADDGKSIDAVGKTGGYRDKIHLGIIKIEGDTLYWCTGTGGKNQNRPTGFEADPGEHSYLIIVKREKKKA